MRRLAFGTHEQQQKAAYEIRVLARTSIFNRSCLIESLVNQVLEQGLNSRSFDKAGPDTTNGTTQPNTYDCMICTPIY
ncbi:uncharacterized protein HKW66_Vig0000430 [Vigna angularis]|uniref:Uncharacterized protein n=1 Tax=Phaseolus angularis TaxID=3914 RepID=A0A8T0LF61_PHAAN|nr:uncharacterized protein HKW66_Vig0000430 [Vigna angularis]